MIYKALTSQIAPSDPNSPGGMQIPRLGGVYNLNQARSRADLTAHAPPAKKPSAHAPNDVARTSLFSAARLLTAIRDPDGLMQTT